MRFGGLLVADSSFHADSAHLSFYYAIPGWDRWFGRAVINMGDECSGGQVLPTSMCRSYVFWVVNNILSKINRLRSLPQSIHIPDELYSSLKHPKSRQLQAFSPIPPESPLRPKLGTLQSIGACLLAMHQFSKQQNVIYEEEAAIRNFLDFQEFPEFFKFRTATKRAWQEFPKSLYRPCLLKTVTSFCMNYSTVASKSRPGDGRAY